MQEIQQNAQEENEPVRISKTIGKMTYEVSVYFNKDSGEGVYDKLKRVIISDNDSRGKLPD